MAFTRTPTESTEQTKIVPLMHAWNTRNISNSKDNDNVNVIMELVNNQITGDKYFEILKRDGLAQVVFNIPPPSAIFGAYYWRRNPVSDPGFWYVIVGAFGIIAYDTNGTQVLNDNTLTFTDTVIGFTEFLYDSGLSGLIITDGITLMQLGTEGQITPITDPDRPNPCRPFPVFLDGYLFVADKRTGSIFGSDLNDPLSWTSSNIISAESYPDPIYALARSGQYIVAFGQTSIQFFYDAGNPTGSPLAPQTTTLQIGYYGGLVSYQDTLLFLGAPTNGNIGVYRLSGLKAELISEAPFARWANSETGNNLRNEQVSINGFILAMNGHSLYTTNNMETSPLTPNLTYALDLDTRLWTRLTFQENQKFNIRTAVTATGGNNGLRSFVSIEGGTSTYEYNSTTYQDAGVNFTVSFVTPNIDFGTYRKKFGSRIMLHADQTPTVSNSLISWTDDDYQTFSTPRAINMASQYKQLFRLGSFRKRAYKLTYSDNFPMRWEFMEIDYSQGAS